MNEKNHLKVNNNNYIYYVLNTDSSKNEDLSKENIFNLDLKKINKDRLKNKSERLKLFDEFFNYKIKKIKMRNKPTPYQKFLKEKTNLKSMYNLKIQQNINSINPKIDILLKNSKIKKFPLKKLSSTLYINKISNYKKKNLFHNSEKKDLYYYYKKAYKDKQQYITSHKSEKKFKNSKKMKLLELITTNDLDLKDFKKPIINYKNESKSKDKKNNFTNTNINININDNPLSILSIIKNKKEKCISDRNVNIYTDFPTINSKINHTENIPSIFNVYNLNYKDKFNLVKYNSQRHMLKNKKEIYNKSLNLKINNNQK